MSSAITRRRFILSSASVAGASLLRGLPPAGAMPSDQGRERRPAFDGLWTDDNETRTSFSFDAGNMEHLTPRAVLRPASVEDVQRCVQYAREYRLPVTMRGLGHTHYGQSLVDGIVIDSSALSRVRFVSDELVDAGPGLTFAEFAASTLTRQRIARVQMHPRVTLGGVASVGGITPASLRHGAFVDTVTELDVVTGEGRLIRCSMRRERELFEMVLGGFGQCGLIVRMRIALATAPAHVVTGSYYYNDPDTFLRECTRAVAERTHDEYSGSVHRFPDGRWSYQLSVRRYVTSAPADAAAAVRGPIGHHTQRVHLRTLAEHVGSGSRVQSRRATTPQAAPIQPSVALLIPVARLGDVLADFVRQPQLFAGLDTAPLGLFATHQFKRPLMRIPKEKDVCVLWVHRRVTSDSGSSLESLLDANRRLIERVLMLGGARYAPYWGTDPTPADARAHYGDTLWKRLVSAKRRYDPDGILTPGAAIAG